jgi:CRP-like cAMP-binding protein
MKQKLISYFSKFAKLTEDEINAISESMDIRMMKKEEFLIKEGQKNRDSYFVLSGLIRKYSLNDGEEITTGLYSEDQWIIQLSGFDNYSIADYNLICVEASWIVVGNEEKAQQLFQQFPRLETISRAVMETVFAEMQKMLTSYLTDTPEVRYLKLLKDRPDLFQRVPQYQIASFIGVKPESLSRIRKRLANYVS